jgi:hypothetical protein
VVTPPGLVLEGVSLNVVNEVVVGEPQLGLCTMHPPQWFIIFPKIRITKHYNKSVVLLMAAYLLIDNIRNHA